MTKPGFREVAILGPGLLGGSLALALKDHARVRLWGRNVPFIGEARLLKMADIYTTDLQEAVAGADLVILCTPIETMAALATQMRPYLAEKAVVTDVGSVKQSVCKILEPILGKTRFIGSHPMAGSEQSGLAAAKKNLFSGAICIVTPSADSPAALVESIRAFWTRLSCEVVTLSAETHDQQIGLISHLPHLLAGCLVNAVAENNASALQLAGQGFRDSTRIASGPPPMWSGILQANRNAVLGGLGSLKTQIAVAEELLREENEEGLRNFLSTAKTKRDGIIRKGRHGGNTG